MHSPNRRRSQNIRKIHQSQSSYFHNEVIKGLPPTDATKSGITINNFRTLSQSVSPRNQISKILKPRHNSNYSLLKSF